MCPAPGLHVEFPIAAVQAGAAVSTLRIEDDATHIEVRAADLLLGASVRVDMDGVRSHDARDLRLFPTSAALQSGSARILSFDPVSYKELDTAVPLTGSRIAVPDLPAHSAAGQLELEVELSGIVTACVGAPRCVFEWKTGTTKSVTFAD